MGLEVSSDVRRFVYGSVEVTIYILCEQWEYYDNETDDYISGTFGVTGKKVVYDYDGCFELPHEVERALSELGYTLDL